MKVESGGADVPVRIPSLIVEIERAGAANQAIVAIREAKAHADQPTDVSFTLYLLLCYHFYSLGELRFAHPQTP